MSWEQGRREIYFRVAPSCYPIFSHQFMRCHPQRRWSGRMDSAGSFEWEDYKGEIEREVWKKGKWREGRRSDHSPHQATHYGRVENGVYRKRKQKTTEMTFAFVSSVFSYPLINHTNKGKRILLFIANKNIFNLHGKQRKTDGKSFIFVAVCHKCTSL